MENPWVYKREIILGDEILKSFRNIFEVVTVKKFASKSGKLPPALKLTLRVLYDDKDYGIDKETGEKRTDNVGQNIDVFVLNMNHDVKRGDYVSLKGFDVETSFIQKFTFWMFFKDLEVVAPPNPNGAGKGNN